MAYHENIRFGIGTISYYDAIREIPDICLVIFPNEDKKEMTLNQMHQLSCEEEWYTIVNECNYGVCDHWISIPFSRWIDKYYPQTIQYIGKDKDVIGYARRYRSVILTKERNFHKSEVWNS